uniref:CHK kinase-like domain-containing protein n=1 Tax=Cuerna arida TaxID=1464854 RepID=A0A1B6GX18_9HEMI
MSDIFNFCSFKWWKMISSPLITALEQDEQFLATVLRSSEHDPHLRLDQLEMETGIAPDVYNNSVTRVHVRGRKGKTLMQFYKTLVIKRCPEQQTRRKDPTFCNEVAVYSSVLPALLQWTQDPSLLPFPACLHTSTNVIVLEDLSSIGFLTGNRIKGLDLDHSVLAFQALGRFHAVSLSLKYQNRRALDNILSQVQEVVFVPEAAPVFGVSLENALELAVTSLKHCPEQVIFDAVQILQSLQGRTFRTLMSLLTPKEPLSVICHGDFWINNVMFRYKNNKVSEVAFTDLQVVRYSSLATDILHFMYTSLEPGLSRDYSDELLKVYHRSLSETMAKIGPSAPPIKLEDISDEIESHALYGLLMSFLVLPNIANSAKKLENSSQYFNNLSLFYCQRVKDIVLEFADKSFI